MDAEVASRRGRRRHGDLGLLAILIPAYVGLSLGAFSVLGVWSDPDRVLFSFLDARQYGTLSLALVSGAPLEHPRLLCLRPFLFPIVLSVHRWVGGAGYVLFQVGLNALALGLVFRSVRKLTLRRVTPVVAVVLLAINPTFVLLPLHGLSECLGLLLVAACCSSWTPGWAVAGTRPGGLFWSALLPCACGPSCCRFC